MNRLILSFLLIASLASVQAAIAHERLIVLGGSLKFPQEAVTQFAEWSQGKDAKVLVIPWATEGQEYENNIIRQLAPYTSAGAFTVAPRFPLNLEQKALFLKQLENATGVFFTGGDQVKIIETLKDDEIKSAIVKKFRAGTPFAGTSAGTAIMSRVMIVDEDDSDPSGAPTPILGKGLCFLPSNVIVDQHFLVRDRELRLRIAMLANPGTMGLGIDETAGFIVEDGVGKAVGPSDVVVLTENGKVLLKNGDKYNLLKKEKVFSSL